MPSEKRARQRAAREAKLAAEARARRRRTLLRNGAIVVVLAAAVIGSLVLITSHSTSKTTASRSSTTTSRPSGSSTTTTVAGATSTTVAATTAAEQAAANHVATAAGCPANPATRVNTLSWKTAPPMTIDPAKTYTATVSTTAGSFVITLDARTAPITVNNFVFLARQGFYHCVIFHRVIPGFMDQTGDPTGTGTGGPGYTIPDEYPPKAANPASQYPIGSVAMANTGQPHTGGSQWFIVTGPQGESLPNTYSLFGTVTSGMNVVQTINAEGNPSPSANGVPPKVVQRILSITISSS
jgi:cyclophilin family peptidyl-prolyl cis-trans isomerase